MHVCAHKSVQHLVNSYSYRYSTLSLLFLMYHVSCFRYGQLSGMVEPVAGILGCIAVSIAEPLLPYSLAFAAGAMIFVVVDDVIPEAHTW